MEVEKADDELERVQALSKDFSGDGPLKSREEGATVVGVALRLRGLFCEVRKGEIGEETYEWQSLGEGCLYLEGIPMMEVLSRR